MIALSCTTCPSDVKELFGIPQKIFIASARRMRQAIAAAQAFSDGGQSLPGLQKNSVSVNARALK